MELSKRKAEKKPQEETDSSADNNSSNDSSNGSSSSESESSDEDVTERKDIPKHMQSQVERLKQIRQRLSQSSQENKREIFQEHQRLQDNPRAQRRQERKRREAEILKHREEFTGDDYERSRFWEYSIEQVEKYEDKKRQREENRERGFTDYAQVNRLKYERDVAKIKPNLSAYQASKGEKEHQDDPQALQRLATSVELQQQRRAKLHKPSVEKEGEEVSYINQKNARFNRKMNRAYDKYTKDIRDNLERGTAL
ncbi:pre-mRNA-splicing factor SYF2 [Coemansia brasiliensis]|uniref:Pre-mRNA-splicing factor SYF2 n=1 Tax=Coemansia brasiliensis TaxID=2650707 RepID=A0A9W8ICV7_9FUNG|nr:pre-mRNA-splicing factor SYF2 [Coemansia brasiliensis]